MASSRYLITSTTLGSSAASVTFSSIPSTYTDLVLRASARDDSAGTFGYFAITVNGSATNYSETVLYGNGSAANSTKSTNTIYFGAQGYIASDTAGNTANTYSNMEFYIPSYTASQNKPASAFSVQESNTTSTGVTIGLNAELWRNTSAITSITVSTSGNNFVSGSSFYLYGLKNS